MYLTNAVKHFKFEQRGKVRIHKKPNAAEIAACRQWWEAEVAAVQPEVLGVLGAVAGQAIFGPQFRVTKERGKWLDDADGHPGGRDHPPVRGAARAPERRDEEYAGLVRDLKLMAAGPRYGKVWPIRRRCLNCAFT